MTTFNEQREFAITQMKIYNVSFYPVKDSLESYYTRLEYLIRNCASSRELLRVLEFNYATLFMHPSLINEK